MDPDKLQQAWQAQSSQTRVTVNADLLLKEVQRNQRDFRALIFRRDVIEVAVGLLLLPYWFYQGITHSLPWTWWLGVPAILWVVGFFLVDRLRHKPKPSEPGESLVESVQQSLAEQEHQIWLLRNVFWWYLLPLAVAILAFFAQVAWGVAQQLHPMAGLGIGVFLCGFLVATYYWLYWLNQRAVRTRLEPRRQELLALLAGLGDDSIREDVATRNATTAPSTARPWRWPVFAAACMVVLVVSTLASGLFGSKFDQPPRIDGPAGPALGSLVTELRKEKNLVGLAAMVTVDGQLEAAAANGERQKGSDVPLAIGDQWHVGGIAKSITATMIARLVEAGQMRWSNTVGEIFPDATIHEDWKPVTLRQLLTDTAGAPAKFVPSVKLNQTPLGAECTKQRLKVVLDVMAEKPAYRPGTKFKYSNVGITIAAVMAEKVTGSTWEDLVKREVFEPLGLTQSGFGPPKSPDRTLPQPRGHHRFMFGKVSVDDTADNTAIMAPSGMIHMTLHDLCTFATEHLRGELGEGKLLSAETYKLLHTPALDDYACGWLKKEPTGEGQPSLYWHNGSNTLWYALVVFIPDTKMVVAVTSNDGDIHNAEPAAWAIVAAAQKKFQAESNAAPKREP